MKYSKKAESRPTASPLIRTACYYDNFIPGQKKAQSVIKTFFLLLTTLIFYLLS